MAEPEPSPAEPQPRGIRFRHGHHTLRPMSWTRAGTTRERTRIASRRTRKVTMNASWNKNITGMTASSPDELETSSPSSYPLVSNTDAETATYNLRVANSEAQPVLISSSWPEGGKYPADQEEPTTVSWPTLDQSTLKDSFITLDLEGPARPFEVTAAVYSSVDESGIPVGEPSVETCTIGGAQLSDCDVAPNPANPSSSVVKLLVVGSDSQYVSVQATWVVETDEGPQDIMQAWAFNLFH